MSCSGMIILMRKKNITVAYSFDIYVDSHVTNLMCLPLICDFHKYFFE